MILLQKWSPVYSTVAPSSVFISALWNVEESTHYSRRIGDEVPGVVAVLFSPVEVSGRLGIDVSKKACGV